MGICHAYAPDGRCISLLKILLTNFCVYDCAYCINRVSSNTPRARFIVPRRSSTSPWLLQAQLHRGLFLSSGIIRDEDYTMAAMNEVARTLREVHDFRGYIHLKVIPDASPELIEEAGAGPTGCRSTSSCPRTSRSPTSRRRRTRSCIKRAMGASAPHRRAEGGAPVHKEKGRAKPPRTAPAGQSTQMIIGATEPRRRHPDAQLDALRLLRPPPRLLFGLQPHPGQHVQAAAGRPAAGARAPAVPGRLADALLRLLKDEIVAAARAACWIPAVDPKLAWALKNRADFPVDVNRARASSCCACRAWA
jgi:predicted DNA-binding helix-hairpin-helix protein